MHRWNDRRAEWIVEPCFSLFLDHKSLEKVKISKYDKIQNIYLVSRFVYTNVMYFSDFRQ